MQFFFFYCLPFACPLPCNDSLEPSSAYSKNCTVMDEKLEAKFPFEPINLKFLNVSLLYGLISVMLPLC